MNFSTRFIALPRVYKDALTSSTEKNLDQAIQVRTSLLRKANIKPEDFNF